MVHPAMPDSLTFIYHTHYFTGSMGHCVCQHSFLPFHDIWMMRQKNLEQSWHSCPLSCSEWHIKSYFPEHELELALIWYKSKISLTCFTGHLKPMGFICNLWGNHVFSLLLEGILIILRNLNSFQSKKCHVLDKKKGDGHCIWLSLLCGMISIHMWEIHYSLNNWPICGWRDKNRVATIVVTELRQRSMLSCVSAHWRSTYWWIF